MPDDRPPPDYRTLAHLCDQQAALTTSETTRDQLKAMAAEYRELAERQERLKNNAARSEFGAACTGWLHLAPDIFS